MKKFLCSCLLLSVLPAAAERGPVPGFSTADPYLIYYGNWDAGKVDAARTNYRMVILHPTSNITPADIATIRRGPDNVASTSDDVYVLAYISVGEDDRPGAPFVGDGNGPRIDPRNSENDPLEGIPPLGDPSTGGTGYASYYLDDDDFNGEPDMNPTFGGPYVNPGDPAWFQVIKNNVKGVDGVAGLDEIMTTSTGLGYGCDGVFLDTLDTPAPNSFGATFFEWTAPAYQQLVKDISDAYPGKLLLGNRGLFFYNPNLKTYNYTLRPYLNLILFESYYTDSSGSGLPSAYFSDNKFNFAPKLNAEADRADGFTVLCLGYTTVGEPPSLGDQDFIESQQVQGWPLYRTNPSLDAAFNTDAATWNATNPDTSPPEWDSTLAYGGDYDPGTPGDQPAPPRVGILEAVPGDGSVTVRWDVARDQTGPVTYNIYYTDQPTLDFNTAVKLAAVAPTAPEAYATSGAIPSTSASEYTVTGLTNGTTYQFAVRAEDGLAQEETNTVTLPATPQGIASDFRSIVIDGSFADWAGAAVLDSDPAETIDPDFAEVSVANDAEYLYVRFTLHSAASAFVDFNSHLFVDTDDNPATGFTPAGTPFGSDLMIESGSGYDQRGGGFNDGSVSGVSWSIANDGGPLEYELRLSRNAIYGNDSQPVFGGGVIRLLLQYNSGDVTASIRYQFAPAPPPPSVYATINVDGDFSDWVSVPEILSDVSGDGIPDIVSVKAANDGDYLYLYVEYASATDTNNSNGSPSTFVSLDNDDNPATGFDIYSLGEIGAEVSWQNDIAFSQGTGVYNSGGVFTGAVPGIAPYASNTTAQEYRIALDATYNTGGGSQPVFPQDTIRLALWTDGTPAEFAGAFRYLLAEPPPPPGYFAAIQVDGDASDWSSIPALVTDPSGDGVPDIVSVKAANDDDWLYLLVEYAAATDTNNLNGSPSTFVSLDNDDDTGTGFDVYGLGEIGAEVSWQNDFVFAQSAGVYNSDATFANAVPGISPYASNTVVQEYRIARNATYDPGGGSQPVFPQDIIRLALWTDGATAEFAGAFRYSFATNPGTDAYSSWKAVNFNPAQLADPLVSGDNADADFDGLVTSAEFALGGDPLAFDSGPAVGSMMIGPDTYLTLTYTQRSDGSATVSPEASGALGGWDENPLQFVTVSSNPVDSEHEEIVIRTADPIPTAPNFIRLSIQIIP